MKRSKKKKKRPYRSAPSKKARKAIWLNLLPDDIWLKVKRGITIYDALAKTKTDLDSECGGLGTCGKCKVRIVTAIGPPDKQEQKLLSDAELENGIRLACRTHIRKSLVVYTDTYYDAEEMYQILKHGTVYEMEIDPLIERRTVEVPPPETSTADSDFRRLRHALGEQGRRIKVTHQCLADLYDALRRTNFQGEALLHRQCLLSWGRPDSNAGRYGIIFDIGTTTLVGKLIDLESGREMAVISRLNSQTRHGSNVIRRIQYIREQKNGLNRMRYLLLRDLNAIIRRLVTTVGLRQDLVFIAVAAGNTTMQHLLLGLDPSGIAEAPFAPVLTEGITFPTAQIGLDLNPDAMLYVMPARSGYIGGDLVSFILASKAIEAHGKNILGLDIGTNGEIFLWHQSRILSCSAAAGPAFEGARISCGMMAKSGAIEGFQVQDASLVYKTIGNIKPRGICGSGLVDLVATLLHHGAINIEGLLDPEQLEEEGDLFASRMVSLGNGEIYDFIAAYPEESLNGSHIYLSQKDIRELQLAKGAVAAGIRILMHDTGINTDDIDIIYLAGALGNYVNPYSAMRIGLIPQVAADKVISMGNAASTGATMALLSKKYWEKALAIADRLEHVELSLHPDFLETFVQEMNFPKENLW